MLYSNPLTKFSFVHETPVIITSTLKVDKKMEKIIRNNAIASIGSDGLMGNKVINISPSGQPAPFIAQGEVLNALNGVNTDDLLQTLSKTNDDMGGYCLAIKVDSATNHNISNKAVLLLRFQCKKRERIGRAILTDTSLALNLNEAIAKIKGVGETTDELEMYITVTVR